MCSVDEGTPGKATLTSTYGSTMSSAQPSGLVSGQSAQDTCAGPNAPIVCLPTAPPPEVTTPPGFDVPVAEQCVLPPPPKDWSTAPAIGECPMEFMSGGPAFKPDYVAGNLDTYKTAFSTSWSELEAPYNSVVQLNRSYKLKEKEVIPLLHVNGGVGVGGAGQNATASFNGKDLKPGATKIDSQKVGAKSGLRDQLQAARDKINSSERAMSNQAMTVEQAAGVVMTASNNVDIAKNSLDIVGIEKEIGDAQLDKDQIKRDLDDYKADIKATVESAKFITSMVTAWANPTKLIDSLNQAFSAGGALSERQVTQDANKQLGALDGKIRGLQHRKADLQAANAMKGIDNATIALHNAVIELRKQAQILQDRKDDYDRSYRDMGTLMEQAGAASGMNPKDAKALSAAVAATPKIEAIIAQLEGMDSSLSLPKYNESSGIGASMCSNLSSFTHALSVVKGNKEYVAEQKALWEGRKASVQVMMDKATTVEGTEW